MPCGDRVKQITGSGIAGALGGGPAGQWEIAGGGARLQPIDPAVTPTPRVTGGALGTAMRRWAAELRSAVITGATNPVAVFNDTVGIQHLLAQNDPRLIATTDVTLDLTHRLVIIEANAANGTVAVTLPDLTGTPDVPDGTIYEIVVNSDDSGQNDANLVVPAGNQINFNGFGFTANTYKLLFGERLIVRADTANALWWVTQFQLPEFEATPAQLTADADDYLPTTNNTHAARVVRLTSNAAVTISGLDRTGWGGAAGVRLRRVFLYNEGTNNITLGDEDAGSAAVNRFRLPNSANLTIAGQAGVGVYYSSASTRWIQETARTTAT